MSRVDIDQRVAQIKHEAALLSSAAIGQSAKLIAQAEAAIVKADKRVLIAGAAVATAVVAGAILYKVLKE